MAKRNALGSKTGKLARRTLIIRFGSGRRLTPSVTRAWLLSVDAAGLLPLDQLREGKFDDIVLPARRGVSPRPAPISGAVRDARAPRPPEELVAASHDRVHIEKAKFIAAVPLKPSKPK